MKTKLLVSIFAVFTIQAVAQDRLDVVVNNIKGDKGVIMVGLFDSEMRFLKDAWKGEKPKAREGTIHVTFQNIPAGEFAVSVIHDENENGKLDSNFIGIPKEGFGFSNDAMGKFGPPSFDKAKFKTPVSAPIAVTMKYY